jgi:FtsZ-interacting cell division protein ZipA
MMRRLQSPEFVVMGLLAAICGIFLALLLSAEFGARSTGGEAALRTSKTPAPDLAKLRQTAVRSTSAHRRKAHRRAHHAKRAQPRATRTAPQAVAQVQTPASQTNGYTQSGQGQASPVQQLSAPSNPAPSPAPVKKQAPRPKPSTGGGTSFDDSG